MFINFPDIDSSEMIIQGMENISIPRMIRVRQLYDEQKIPDVSAHVRARMEKVVTNKEWFQDKRICITAGSRGIPNLADIIAAVCGKLQEWGAKPFVIPAMGSHGGGTAEGQSAILAGYGITQETMGVPVVSCMDVVQYGTLSNGTPLYCDRHAFESDGIVLLNKQKPHTDFRGPHESGLAKMVAIGLAKHVGASAFHMQGFKEFPVRVPEAAVIFLKTGHVVLGIGMVQNAYDEICELDVAMPDDLMEMDRRLLMLAKERLATLKFKDLDVLIIDKIGKDISGYGQDPNVTGRANGSDPSFKEILELKKMVILGMTEGAHHNGSGIAEADVTTVRCMRDIDWGQVWTNLITSTEIQGCKMPLYMNNDREAIRLAIRTCNGIDFSRPKVARIHTTLDLFEIEVSEALYEELRDRKDIEYIEGPYDLPFDREGFLV